MKSFNNLSEQELLQIDGGIAFVPILIAGAKIFGASAVTAFAATAVGKIMD